jgi:hypothetical protein
MKINELDYHPNFYTTGTKLRLIGLVEPKDVDNAAHDAPDNRYLYAPFGYKVKESNRGIYISNNPKVASWFDK